MSQNEETGDGTPRKSSRSRWGCVICRKRKVKCDEARPTCGHCSRLRLPCSYRPHEHGFGSRARRAIASHGPQTNSTTDLAFPSITPAYSLERVDSGVGSNQTQISLQSPAVHSQGSSFEVQPSTLAIISPDTTTNADDGFWHTDILGEESIWAHLPIFSDLTSSTDPRVFESSAQTMNDGHALNISNRPALDFSFVSEAQNPTDGLNVSQYNTSNPVLPNIAEQSPTSILSFSDIPSYEVNLLRHFVDFAVPPILIGVEPRWNSARITLFKVAKSNALVRHAICSFSALSLAKIDTQGSASSHQSSSYFYELALSELQTSIDNLAEGDNTKLHEHILASIFFLSYVELMMSSSPKHTLELLRRAHGIMRSNRPSRSPLGNQLRIWLKLLDAKVVSTGGEGIHLHDNPDLKDFEGPSDARESTPLSDHSAIAPHTSTAPTSDPGDILFNCINHSAYNFYLQVLDFAGRIAHLDRWHRSRGSVDDELEVMHAARKLLTDLDSLWERRPALLDLAAQKDAMSVHLSAGLARNVESHLRTYVANFYACFVHAQRAVFPHLPTTPKTSEAVNKIIELVRLSDSDQLSMSVSMLWPLMMASCEVKDLETREWLINIVEGMKSVGNAERTARLIREICKRQEGGHRSDAREVMQDIFGTIFAII